MEAGDRVRSRASGIEADVVAVRLSKYDHRIELELRDAMGCGNSRYASVAEVFEVFEVIKEA